MKKTNNKVNPLDFLIKRTLTIDQIKALIDEMSIEEKQSFIYQTMKQMNENNKISKN
jgi:hypothetical protein